MQKVRKSGVGVRQIAQSPRVWVLGFAQEGERSGGNTLYELVAGEGTDEDLDTWRRAAAAVAQSSQKESAREREARVHCTAPGHPGTGVIGETVCSFGCSP